MEKESLKDQNMDVKSVEVSKIISPKEELEDKRSSHSMFFKEMSGMAFIAITYWIFVRLGLLLVARPEGIASIWPASGFALAVLLIRPKHQWAKLLAVIFVTNALCNWSSGNSLPVSIGYAAANTIEPALCAWFMVYLCKSKITFESKTEAFAILFTAALINGITALLGASVSVLAFHSSFGHAWLIWWAADGLGIILITPLIVTWANNKSVVFPVSWQKIAEKALLLLMLGIISWVLFGNFTIVEKSLLRNYMFFPLLIWLAIRFTTRGMITILLLFSIVTIFNTLNGFGIFAEIGQTRNEHLASLQIFLALITCSGLILNSIFIEQRRLKGELNIGKQRLELAQRSAGAGTWNWNMLTQQLEWSNELYTLFGLDPASAEATFDTWNQTLHPDDMDIANHRVEQAIKNKTTLDSEYRVIHPDGKICWIKAIGDTQYDSSGNPLSMNGICIDITERKLAEEATREKDILFRKLSSNVSDMIYQFTRKPDGTYFVPVASEGIKNIFGCSPEDVLEDFAPIARVIFPDDSDRVIADIEYSAKHMTFFTCEFRVQIPGKPIQWMYSKSTPEKLADGSVTWYGFNADITERKQAEEDIRKNEQKHRTILHTAMDGFWLLDMHGNLLEVNEIYCEMSGYNAQELLTMNVSDLSATETANDVAAHIQKIMDQGEDRFETQHRRKDGTIFDIESSVQYWPIEGGQFVAFLHDITERKQTEHEKRQFYRDTIKSVTQGKLDLVSFDEIQEYIDSTKLVSTITCPADIANVRHEIIEYCKLGGLGENKLGMFELAIGEAMTNAIKHANDGRVYVGMQGDSIWVAISDNGSGMSTMTLPNATLRRGYSSKVSMGMGYTIMLEASAEIKLCTSSQGTTVVLSVDVTTALSALSLDDFQDIWDEIPNVMQ